MEKPIEKILDDVLDFDQCAYKTEPIEAEEEEGLNFEDMMDNFYQANFESKTPFVKKRSVLIKEEIQKPKVKIQQNKTKNSKKSDKFSSNNTKNGRKSDQEKLFLNQCSIASRHSRSKSPSNISKDCIITSNNGKNFDPLKTQKSIFNTKKNEDRNYLNSNSILKARSKERLGKEFFPENIKSAKKVSFNKQVFVLRFKTQDHDKMELEENNSIFLKNMRKQKSTVQ